MTCDSRFTFSHLAIWQGFCVWWQGGCGSEYAVYLTHVLSMLHLIETFCESAPQLTHMMYIMLHCNQGIDIMDSTVGEWLYRATMGPIWYFNWFNIAEGHIRSRSVIYHAFMITNSGILLVTWWFSQDVVMAQLFLFRQTALLFKS
ncbi:XK-related protein 8-like [Xyrauchen texanus]|uniref:XK-related protein 8-like n=1 Tax=Xyrauchen texanus TaxID=154827 RepID=UPI002242A9DB|nr:XK-related protein 8-like [Xyrauchen texanus]